MKRLRILLIGLLIIIGIAGYMSVYTVNEREQALVIQFGAVKYKETKPGLHFKLPWQSARYFDRRLLDYDSPVKEIPTRDQKQVLVDTFARYRITDALQFYISNTGGNQLVFENRLRTTIENNVGAEFAKVELLALLTPQRAQLMDRITKKVQTEMAKLGVNVVDVRVKRLDLPKENSEAIFQRMETQRRQEAIRIRAEGERDAKRIRADADKRSRVLKAEAERKAQVLRGEGEAVAQKLYNTAFGKDPEFFEFWLSMNVLKESLKGENTRYIGPARGDFLRYLNSMTGKAPVPQK
jgi:membrane protease subunit HflC